VGEKRKKRGGAVLEKARDFVLKKTERAGTTASESNLCQSLNNQSE
jgi:hypothetical protein